MNSRENQNNGYYLNNNNVLTINSNNKTAADRNRNTNKFYNINGNIYPGYQHCYLRQNPSFGQYQNQYPIHSETSYNSNNLFVLQDGIQSGVPTITTPTLTPTTLRNIEQTLIEWTTEPQASAPPFQAGFVPPLAPFHLHENADTNSVGSSDSESQSSWQTPVMHEENSMATTDNSSATMTGSPTFQNATNPAVDSASISTPPRRNQGGRRPTKQSNISPEEEEKRRVRRERNKLAAARCRKRRVDQTNELLDKVAVLEKEKEKHCKEIESLKLLKEDLEIRIEAHRPTCRLNAGLSGFSSNPKISANTSERDSPLDMKPVLLPETFIKDEPIDSMDSLDGPPSPKRIMLSHNNPLVATLPNVSTISTTLASASAVLLNTPTLTTSPIPTSLNTPPTFPAKPHQLKARPSSLNVPIQIAPSQAIALGKSVSNINGVAITTPSAGVMFNFDSLMQGGTGLTPVSGPLMPTCSSQNKHPLELTTPTSEPSKLVSL